MRRRFDEIFFPILTVLARVTGVLWILGGAVAVATAGHVQGSPVPSVALGLFFILAGIGLLVARPITRGQVRQFIEGPRKDSTDQRGPDEWQA